MQPNTPDHTPPQSISINDLLLSPNTNMMLAKLRLTPSFSMARATGARRGYRVRQRGFVHAESATFVQIEILDENRRSFWTLVLVEESWKSIVAEDVENRGIFALNSADAQLAIAELEARLRLCPELATVEIGTRIAGPVNPPSSAEAIPMENGSKTKLPITSSSPLSSKPLPPLEVKPVAVPDTADQPKQSNILPVAPSISDSAKKPDANLVSVVTPRDEDAQEEMGGAGEATEHVEYERFDPEGANVGATAVPAPTPEQLAEAASMVHLNGSESGKKD